MHAVAATRRWAPLALLVSLFAAGCASSPSRTLLGGEAARRAGWDVVDNVAEVRQSSSDGCGAAALAMVLAHWGRPVTQDEIRAAIPAAQGQGIRADALRDFARAQGLEAFLFEGRPSDLAREVRRDRPVLVGTMKRQGGRAYPHYEVVVGVHPARQRILTLDPARGPRETTLEKFAKEWAEAGRLTVVVFPRAAPPATVVHAPSRASGARE